MPQPRLRLPRSWVMILSESRSRNLSIGTFNPRVNSASQNVTLAAYKCVQLRVAVSLNISMRTSES